MHDPQRILAVQVKMIGDLLLTLPALKALRQKWPDAQLEVLTLGPAAQLAPCLPWLDAVHSWDKRRMNLSTLRPLLREARPDLSLDFSGTDRAALFTALGRERIGYRKYARESRSRRALYTQLSPAILKRQHACSYYLGLLEPLGLAPKEGGEPPKVELHIPDLAHAEADCALGMHGIEGPFIALQPGSARAEKFWPASHWAKLIARLSKQGQRIVLLGGNSRVERDHLDRIELLGMAHSPVNLGGKLNLPASIAALSRASSLIGVDSALTHLAALLQMPQLTLYGTTEPFHWGPWSERALTLHAAFPDQPRPTRSWSWENKPPETSLRQLPVDQVLRAFEQLG